VSGAAKAGKATQVAAAAEDSRNVRRFSIKRLRMGSRAKGRMNDSERRISSDGRKTF
jgi:hypothetical protein